MPVWIVFLIIAIVPKHTVKYTGQNISCSCVSTHNINVFAAMYNNSMFIGKFITVAMPVSMHASLDTAHGNLRSLTILYPFLLI